MCYKKALELKLEYPIPHNNLGATYYELGSHITALKHYLKAIELNPEYALAYDGLGKVYDDIGMHDEAEECFKIARELSETTT